MSEKDGLNKFGTPYGKMTEVLGVSDERYASTGQQDDVYKPKEFWFHREPYSDIGLIAEAGETRPWEGTHVIEYSAYKSALGGMAEYAKRVRELERACVDWETKVREITDERDEARAETLIESQRWKSALATERARSAKLVEALKKIDPSQPTLTYMIRKQALAEYDKDHK